MFSNETFRRRALHLLRPEFVGKTLKLVNEVREETFEVLILNRRLIQENLI